MNEKRKLGTNKLKQARVLLVLFMAYCWGSSPLMLNAVEKASRNEPVTLIIDWKEKATKGKIKILNGSFLKLKILKGKGKILKDEFLPSSAGDFRLELSLSASLNKADRATIVQVETLENPFSFFVRDVNKLNPVLLKEFGVAVLTTDDTRNYVAVEAAVKAKKLKTALQKLNGLPEESYEAAASSTIEQVAPTLLGISRDFRIFQLDERTAGNATFTIQPTLSSQQLAFPAINMNYVAYAYAFGRGLGVHRNLTRSIEDGIYPIRHALMKDEEVEYHATAFVSLEYSPLKKSNVRGTHFLVADKYSAGSMHTKEQQQLFDSLKDAELNTGEETVLYYQVSVTNKADVPKYAWFKTIKPGTAWWINQPYSYEASTGFSRYTPDSVFAVSKQDGKPLASEETAVLLQPGETTVFEFYLPHGPVSKERAKRLAAQNFEQRKSECKQYWAAKLAQGGQIKVPERRIDEMVKAGLLHLDLVTFGKENKGTLAPLIGKYSPIGTESSPIIQFYASMGWFDIAKRSVTFFLDKQHKNGFIQNFNGYMVETGAALYTMGEYLRYNDDMDWLRENKERIQKSCDYLIKWRNDNKKKEFEGTGYGMIAGKVADPEDHFPQYMLNGYGYIGLKRMAEAFRKIDGTLADRLQKEADEWKADIRKSFFQSNAQSPVLPLNDGTWVSSTPPWAGGTGPRTLNIESKNYWSHGTFTVPDGLLGPLHLVFCEVLDPNEPAAIQLLNYHADILFQQNTAFSQPYYSRHDWMQAKLGLVKPFLKNYYDSVTALADRETHTFWEHVFGASSHKTHEEAWFLMQTRWMLYMEEGNSLNLLKMIPRAWMEDGKEIVLDNVQSYFGKVKLKTRSNVNKGYIEADVECNGSNKPEVVSIRLPHPENKKAVNVTGGKYDPETETVTLSPFTGKATIKLEF